MGMDGFAVAIGGYPPVVVLDPDGAELGALERPPSGEHVECGGVEIDAAT